MSARIQRSFALLISLAIGFLLTERSAVGQTTYTWNGVTTGSATWLTPSNWTADSSYPGSTSGVFDTATFGPILNPTGTLTITTPANVYLNAINFNQTTTTAGYSISGGTINLGGAAPTISVLTVGVTETIGSVLAGSSGLTVTGSGNLTLTGANTYTGTTTVGIGTLTIGPGGSLNGTTGTALTFTNASSFVVNEGANSNQGMGALSFSGGDGTVTSTFTSGSATLTFSSLQPRTAGATGNFVLGGGTAGTPGNPGTAGTNNIVLTGQATGFIDQGTFFGGSNYAFYDAGGFVRGINWGVDAGSTTVAGGNNLTSGLYAQTTGAITAQGTDNFAVINIVNTANAANAFTLAGGATLTTNGILLSGGTTTGLVTTISGGTAIQAAGSELVIRTDSVNDQLVISTPVTATNLTKTGAGTLTFTAANTFTGSNIYVNQGNLTVASGATSALGSAAVNFGGGTLNTSVQLTNALNIPAGQFGVVNLTTNGVALGVGSPNFNTPVTLNGTLLITRTGGAAGATIIYYSFTGSGTLEVGITNGTGGPASPSSTGRAEFESPLNFSQPNEFSPTSGFSGTIHVLPGGNFAFPNALGPPETSSSGLSGAYGTTILLDGPTTGNTGGYFSIIGGTSALNAVGYTPILTPIGGLNGAGTVVENSNSGRAALVIGNANASGNFSGVLKANGLNSSSGKLDLIKVGSGTQVLSGQSTSLNGIIWIETGILQLGTNSATGVVGALNNTQATWLGASGLSGILQLGDVFNPASVNLPNLLVSGNGTANAVVGGNAAISNLSINVNGTNGMAYNLGTNGTAGNTNAPNDSYTGNLGGAGTNYNNLSLTKNGGAVLTLSGIDTYIGSTTINNGTLQLGSVNALPIGTSVSLGAGSGSTGGTGILDLNGFNATVSGLSVGGSFNNNVNTIGNSSTTPNSNSTLTFINGTSTFTGAIQDNLNGVGSNQVTLQVNSGNLTLSGNNTYSGGTNLISGQLNINSATAIGTGNFAISAGATFDNASGSPITLSTNNTMNWNGNFTFGGSNALNMGAGQVTLSPTTGTNIMATVNGNYSTALTVGGNITDNGSGFSFTKAGPGTLVLSGTNTYTGGTTITGGILQFNASTAIAGPVLVNFGAVAAFGYAFGQTDLDTIAPASAGVVALAASTSNNLDFSTATGANLPSVSLGAVGAFTYSGTLTPTSNVYRLGGGGGVLTVASSLADFRGTQLIINGNGTTTGTVVLTMPSAYSGGTTILSGTLNINSDSALGATSGVVNLTGGTLQFAAGGGIALNSSRSIVVGGGAFDTNFGNDTINGVISGNDPVNSNLIKNGLGNLVLTNTNTYAGSTIVNAGGLVVSSTASLGSGPLLVNNTNPAPSSTDVYLYNTSGQTIGNLSSNLSGAANGNTVGVFLGAGVALTVNQTAPTTFQGTIFGGGNLVLGSSSTSTLTLTGNSTYGGSTTINGGTIQLGVANALPATTALTLGSGGMLNLNNNNQTIAALNSSAGNINTGSGTGGILTVGNTAGGTVTYSGVISGTGGLTWGIVNTNVPNPTPSTLLLTSASTNTGPMTINTGTLSIGTAYALSGGVAPVLPYSVSATYPGAFTLGPTATLLTNGLNVTVGSLGGGGPIGGNINLGNNSSSTLYIVQSSSTGYAGIISGTGNVYIVNGVNLAVYGNWTLTGGVTHDVTNLQGNHTDSPKSYLPFAIAGNSAVTTQGINFAGFTDQVSTIFGGSSADNNAAGTFVDTGSVCKLVHS